MGTCLRRWAYLLPELKEAAKTALPGSPIHELVYWLEWKDDADQSSK
jgi:hypothetical protein